MNPALGVYKRIIFFLSGILLFFTVIIPLPAKADENAEYHLDLIKDSSLTVAGLSFALIRNRLVSHVHAPDPASLDRDNVPGIDRAALDRRSSRAGNLSNVMLDISSILPFLAAASVVMRGDKASYRQAIADLGMYAEAGLITAGLTQIAKGGFHRSRPYAYDPSVPLASREARDAALSFFSGHASGAFTGAVFACTVYQRQHPGSKFIIPFWILSLSTATVTAVMRVEAGVHFPTDVLAGAAVGSLTGWLVPCLQEKKPKRFEVITSSGGIPGYGISYSF
jgi:membrane-associated phospholipid phosphatase